MTPLWLDEPSSLVVGWGGPKADGATMVGEVAPASLSFFLPKQVWIAPWSVFLVHLFVHMGDDEHRRRRIAAEDFHLQLCQCYAASDSPFGHLDCQILVNALRTAFSEATQGHGNDMRAVPSSVVSAALRGFLGVGGSLWHYEQRMCAMLHETYGEPLDATELISDFGARLGAAQRGAGSAGAGFLSKVDLRRALVDWLAPRLPGGASGHPLTSCGAAPLLASAGGGTAFLPGLLGGRSPAAPPPPPPLPVLTSPLTSPLTSSQLRISSSPGSMGAAVAPLDPYTRDPYTAGYAGQPVPPLAWPRSPAGGQPTWVDNPTTVPSSRPSVSFASPTLPTRATPQRAARRSGDSGDGYGNGGDGVYGGGGGSGGGYGRGAAARGGAAALATTLEQAAAAARVQEQCVGQLEAEVIAAEGRIATLSVEAQEAAAAHEALRAELASARRDGAAVAHERAHAQGAAAAAAARAAAAEAELEACHRTAHAQGAEAAAEAARRLQAAAAQHTSDLAQERAAAAAQAKGAASAAESRLAEMKAEMQAEMQAASRAHAQQLAEAAREHEERAQQGSAAAARAYAARAAQLTEEVAAAQAASREQAARAAQLEQELTRVRGEASQAASRAQREQAALASSAADSAAEAARARAAAQEKASREQAEAEAARADLAARLQACAHACGTHASEWPQ